MLKSTIVALTAGAIVAAAGAREPVKVLLITGQQNHDWEYTSKVHARTLEATGRFKVDTTTNPAETLADAAKLKGYQVLFLDYNGARWGDAAEKNFVDAVNGGTGVVCVHASNNSFIGWSEYEKMVGLLWIKDTTGHGKFHSFDVNYTNKDHPITKGLSDMKAHPDELYHRLVNTQKAKFTLLASAMSTKESGGTGESEPMALTLEYGKGRIFHTPLGHVWPGSADQRASINDPQFKILVARGTEWAATGAVTLPATWTFGVEPPRKAEAAAKDQNMLTDAEKADGWKLLFDGKDPVGLRGFKKEAFPDKGWKVTEGTLQVTAKGNGGDIVTKDEYENFEFSADWKVSEGANSGIMYLCAEDKFTYPWETGPEMQILDNAKHQDGKDPKTSAGSLYALIACSKEVTRPVGEWNTAKVLKKGNHIEHWLNGTKVVEYEIGSPEWRKLVDASKFKAMPAYGTKSKGRISLQDHGDDVWFRNIKVRELK